MISRKTLQALNAVYETFGRVAKPARIAGCPCCTSPDDFCPLLTTPLRLLSPGQLMKYGAKAMTTVGSVDDFRYFLPRLMEISIAKPGWWPDREILLSKLPYGAWQDWPHPERAALVTLFASATEDALAAGLQSSAPVDFEDDPEIEDIDRWLCSLAAAHLPVAPWRARLLEAAYAPVLARFHHWHAMDLAEGRLRNGSWDMNASEMTLMIEWLNSDAVAQQVRPYWH